MATKGSKNGKAKGKTKAKAKAARDVVGAEKREARPRETVANYIRDLLGKAGKDYVAADIAEKAAKKFPDKKPTAGYVNWINEHAREVSTTTSEAVV